MAEYIHMSHVIHLPVLTSSVISFIKLSTKQGLQLLLSHSQSLSCSLFLFFLFLSLVRIIHPTGQG